MSAIAYVGVGGRSLYRPGRRRMRWRREWTTNNLYRLAFWWEPVRP